MDQARIDAELRDAQREDREISDDIARLIASQWHGGQDSLLYGFASTGKLSASATETWGEVAADYSTASGRDRLALDYLGTYLLNCAERA